VGRRRLRSSKQSQNYVVRRDEFYADHNGPKGAAVRERTMYETFRKVYARMGGGRWYGRWGSFHVLQRNSGERERFAVMLNREGSPVAGKVLSILSVYRDSQAMTAAYKTIPAASEFPVERFTGAGPLTLFRLESADAIPAQYVMLIQKATASHPLEEDLPPVVVRSVPESGSRDVPAGLQEIRVTFSNEMKDRSWSWCGAGAFQAPPLSNVHYDVDHRTIVGTAKLEAGKQYAVVAEFRRVLEFPRRAGAFGGPIPADVRNGGEMTVIRSISA
jgi:hypothetical protein